MPNIDSLMEYRHQGACVLRTPLLAFDVVRNGITRETLERHLEDPIVREALYVASPTLDTAIDAWLANPEDPRARDVELIVVRYLSRMAARPTPFGLFSGCGLASISERTSLSVWPAAECRRSSRLDMQYLALLAEALERAPQTRATLRFRPNSSMVVSKEEIRFVETSVHPTTRARAVHLVAAEPSDALMVAIRATEQGAATQEDIRDAILRHHASVTPDEVATFVDGLVDAQIFESNVQPRITTEDPLLALTEALASTTAPVDGGGAGTAHEETRRVVEGLSKVHEALRAIDAQRTGVPRERYREIMSTLEALPVPLDPARLFQVDLFKPGDGVHVGERVVREVRRAIALIHRLTPRRRAGPMHWFRERFTERYGDREVPLAEALDEERGLGFVTPYRRMGDAAPLLAGMVFPDAGEQGASLEKMDARNAYKLARLLALREDGLREWKLDARDLEKMAEPDPEPLPSAFAAMVTIGATSNESIDAGDFDLHLHHVSGPSGVSLLGRFCHGDADVRALVERHMEAEERLRPDAVFAEVVHLPEGRVGNVICRPVLRTHEIAYLGNSGMADNRQIPLDDLWVSVRGGQVRLRSAKLGREVLPRLTSRHNYGVASLAMYGFLGTLQHEGVAPRLAWTWGPLEDAVFLPRVSHGRFVLSLARWTFEASQVERIAHDVAFRQARGLPRWVSVMEGDHLLPLDLEGEGAGSQLMALARGREKIRLQELFPEPERMCAAGAEGRYTHELVIPFVRAEQPEKPENAVPALAPRLSGTREARTFLPGSRWLFAKIYTGPATGDRVLRSAIAPLVRELRDAGLIERWFFMRYGDPEHHLRVRFEGDPAQLMAEVLPRLQKVLAPRVASGYVVKVVLDTYEREVERYGGPLAMPLAERIFEADSDATLEILNGTASTAGADARWRVALRGMVALLGDAGVEGDARRALLVHRRDALAKEHRADTAFRKTIGARYRADRAAIERMASGQPAGESAGGDGSPANGDAMMAELLGLIEMRSAAVAPAFAELRALRDGGRLDTSWQVLVTSLIHMHVNRVIRADARAHELVLYEYLVRAFESAAARTK